MSPGRPAPKWLKVFRDDGTGLAIIGVLSILRGISYTPVVVNVDRSPAHALEALLPVTVWAWVWIAIGALCLVAIAWRRLSSPAVGLAVGIHTAWALSFIAAWLWEDSQRGWLSALGYIGVAFLFLWAISRGTRAEVTLRFHDDTTR